MDGVNEPDENGKISNLSDPDAKKQTFGRRLQNSPKPQGQKWHFTQISIYTLFMYCSTKIMQRIFYNILNAKIPWPSIPSEMSYEAQDMINRFLIHDPNQRLGAHGSSEVKAHPFFNGVNWDTLSMQKVAFVPHPSGMDDTSYFVSRHSHSSSETFDDQDCSDVASDASEFFSDTKEKTDEYRDLAEFKPSACDDLSWINFSFKNLSQLASINHDVLVQNSKDASRCSSPHNGPTS